MVDLSPHGSIGQVMDDMTWFTNSIDRACQSLERTTQSTITGNGISQTIQGTRDLGTDLGGSRTQ